MGCIDKSYVNRCMCKAVAYSNCCKNDEAVEWLEKLVEYFEQKIEELNNNDHGHGKEELK